ncbi:MAG TPA: isoprenylcysteine carboxylmethyltransferase family protein [Candidatus Acidoferrales bacterium]
MAGSWVTRWRVRAGYPLSILYIALAAPTIVFIAIGAAVAAVGLIVRAAAAGHLRKLETLTTSGPYAWTRNPLYLGSSLLAAGFAIAGGSPWSALVIAAYFLTFYPAVMKKEEAELHVRYGQSFDEYAARVPLFWPRPPHRASGVAGPKGNGEAHFSWKQYQRNREYQAAIGVFGALLFVYLRMLVRRRTGW